ncbi:hypothetical protein GTG28_15110 [Vibrio sp. OCN044]|uniref:Bacterial Pleckstrin homology domain-containing protein n=1 Tax=Vibrio tetraodonis subsp. pristinus TaxID=2695891 RepID=A0A6L8M0J2_9VIBR|nr:hypothetical protein [Vibrio tetraodonis]MYM60560.1 hypothetical protein [Vibrio tetraodonis subsp. pristinus]
MTQNITAGGLVNVIISIIFISALFLTISKAHLFSLNGLIFILLTCVYLGILYQINTSKVTISEDRLSIVGFIWSYTERKENIINIEIVDKLNLNDEISYRNNGVSIFSYKAGKFTLESNSSAFLLTNGIGKYVIVSIKNSKFKKIILNLDDVNIDRTLSWFNE